MMIITIILLLQIQKYVVASDKTPAKYNTVFKIYVRQSIYAKICLLNTDRCHNKATDCVIMQLLLSKVNTVDKTRQGFIAGLRTHKTFSVCGTKQSDNISQIVKISTKRKQTTCR